MNLEPKKNNISWNYNNKTLFIIDDVKMDKRDIMYECTQVWVCVPFSSASIALRSELYTIYTTAVHIVEQQQGHNSTWISICLLQLEKIKIKFNKTLFAISDWYVLLSSHQIILNIKDVIVSNNRNLSIINNDIFKVLKCVWLFVHLCVCVWVRKTFSSTYILFI